MNDNPKPIDQPLDNRKASPAEQVPVLHRQHQEKRKAIRHDPEPDGHRKPEAQADPKSAYGRMVVEHGYDSVHDPVKLAAFLHKEAACRKAGIIDRRDDRAGGMDEVEWACIGPDGRVNGIVSGPEGRFSIKSVFAGGYNI